MLHKQHQLLIGSVVFGTLTFSLLGYSFLFMPDELPRWKYQLLGLFCAAFPAFFMFFFTGTLSLRSHAKLPALGQLKIRAGGGIGMFVLVLLLWQSGYAPVSQQQLTDAIHKGSIDVQKSISEAKRESSSDPRKELMNRGIPWSIDHLLTRVLTGDVQALQAFIDGGMSPHTRHVSERPLPIMLALNKNNPAQVLQVLLSGNLDVNHRFESDHTTGEPRTYTLLQWAVTNENLDLVEALITHHVDVHQPIEVSDGFNSTRMSTPLREAHEKLADVKDKRRNPVAAQRIVKLLEEARPRKGA